jgi:hypothetical protein
MSVSDKGKGPDSLPPLGSTNVVFSPLRRNTRSSLKHNGEKLLLENCSGVRDCTPPIWPGSSAR